jgi:hypothetical protein
LTDAGESGVETEATGGNASGDELTAARATEVAASADESREETAAGDAASAEKDGGRGTEERCLPVGLEGVPAGEPPARDGGVGLPCGVLVLDCVSGEIRQVLRMLGRLDCNGHTWSTWRIRGRRRMGGGVSRRGQVCTRGLWGAAAVAVLVGGPQLRGGGRLTLQHILTSNK